MPTSSIHVTSPIAVSTAGAVSFAPVGRKSKKQSLN